MEPCLQLRLAHAPADVTEAERLATEVVTSASDRVPATEVVEGDGRSVVVMRHEGEAVEVHLRRTMGLDVWDLEVHYVEPLPPAEGGTNPWATLAGVVVMAFGVLLSWTWFSGGYGVPGLILGIAASIGVGWLVAAMFRQTWTDRDAVAVTHAAAAHYTTALADALALDPRVAEIHAA